MTAARFSLLIWLILLAASPVRAADENSGKPVLDARARVEQGNGSAKSQAEIQRLIQQIGAADYAAREEATRQLLAAGRQAIPLLAEAAAGDDMETAYRAVRVLQSF